MIFCSELEKFMKVKTKEKLQMLVLKHVPKPLILLYDG